MRIVVGGVLALLLTFTSAYGDAGNGGSRAHRPRHWVLLNETVHAMRRLVESAELAEAPRAARRDALGEDVSTLLHRSAETRALVDYLVGRGRIEAGAFLRDFQVLALKRTVPALRAIVEASGFPRLADGLGLSGAPGPARDYLVHRVQEEVGRLGRLAPATDAIADAQNRMKRGTRGLEHAAFVLTILAGLAVGDVAFQAANYVGLRNLPLGRVAAAIGAGISTTVCGFNTLWPMGQECLSKLFLRGRYERLAESYLQMLFLDLEIALPQIVAMALPSRDVVQAQEDAALDAIVRYVRPETTEALFSLAIANLERGFDRRADKILGYVVARGTDTELGQLAAAARESIAAHKAFHRDLGKLKRRFIARKVWKWSGVLGAALAAACYFHPDGLTFTQALVLQGIGFAGLRAMLWRIWPRYPQEQLREHLAGSTERLEAPLRAVLERGSRAGPAIGTGAGLDLREASVDVVVGLAKIADPGEAGAMIRHTAREALHRFDDDLAMAFLILRAHREILRQAISQREPADQVHDMVRRTLEQDTACLEQILRVAEPPRPPVG